MLCIYVRNKRIYIGQYMYLLSDFLSLKYRHRYWPQKASETRSFINCHILIFGLLTTWKYYLLMLQALIMWQLKCYCRLLLLQTSMNR